MELSGQQLVDVLVEHGEVRLSNPQTAERAMC
jgi:hypothetical protein